MWSTWEVTAESLFAQASLVLYLTIWLMKEFVMPTVSEESQRWAGPAPAFAYIDGVAVLPALAVLLVIFLLGLTLLGPFLGLEGAWLSRVFAYCSVSEKQKW